MADKDGNIIAKDYGIGIKPPAQHFHVKGHENAGCSLVELEKACGIWDIRF